MSYLATFSVTSVKLGLFSDFGKVR